MHISIISASTRMDRKSHRVALALESFLKSDGRHTVELLDLAEYNLPIFDEVLHRHPNPPADLKAFAESIVNADAFLFVSPEYNGSYTSALKNAVDYLKESEFAQKTIGTVSVSAGGMGGMRAAMNMQELILGISGFPIPQMLLVGQVGQKFDEVGNLLDETFEPKIRNFIDRFLWLAEAVWEKKQASVLN